MRHPKTGLLVMGAALALLSCNKPPAPKPTRVMIVVMDQMRPEYVDLFDMTNVRALMNGGVSYPNAYLGHMASETVISHAVMTSGQYPKNLGWSDEVYRDADNVLGQGANAYHVSGSMSRAQFNSLIQKRGYPMLSDYLHQKFPGTKFIAVAQKGYAVYSAAGPSADIIVTFSGRNFDCNAAGSNNWRGPTGLNVPTYLSEPQCGRFYINSARSMDYGTRTTPPAWMYPEDGDRFFPGNDPAHLGGDNWVADAAMEMMEREEWSGMLVSLGGIDKVGHMWGGITDTQTYAPGSNDEMAHLRFIAKNADAQLGRMVEKMRALGQLDQTLIVITADHGGLPATKFHGVNEAGRSDFNWYYGQDADETYKSASPALSPLLATDNVAFSYQDSAIRTWLTDASMTKKQQAARIMRSMPDVIATWYLDGDHYVLDSASTATPMTASEQQWFDAHAREIVDTMAAPWGPDVVGLLADETSYGVAGDHGGAQKTVQKIPMVLAGPGLARGAQPSDEFRCVDITPTALKLMGIEPTFRVDGKAQPVPLAQ
ncbi:MAG TPA: alkaline phosphatase family protein [Myxococcaceae bacterium]|nr:alkaline phosphatase family protein [Myxococcaceae bacterium]